MELITVKPGGQRTAPGQVSGEILTGSSQKFSLQDDAEKEYYPQWEKSPGK